MLGLQQNEERSGRQIRWGVMGHRLISELLFTMTPLPPPSLKMEHECVLKLDRLQRSEFQVSFME